MEMETFYIINEEKNRWIKKSSIALFWTIEILSNTKGFRILAGA